MTGRNRRPRSPGVVEVFCTGLGAHEHRGLGPLRAAWNASGEVMFTWGRQWNGAPVTDYRAPDGRVAWWRDSTGRYTFEFRCIQPGCRVHVKLTEAALLTRIRSRAESQRVQGRAPVWFDISSAQREESR